MSERWGSFQEVARLGERLTALETTLPHLRIDMERRFDQLSNNQIMNRAWTEKQFEELKVAVAARPVASATEKRVELIVAGIAAGIVILIVLLFLLWLRLGA